MSYNSNEFICVLKLTAKWAASFSPVLLLLEQLSSSNYCAITFMVTLLNNHWELMLLNLVFFPITNHDITIIWNVM